MATPNMKTKLTEILHDAKAAIWTDAGHHLKKVQEHSKILDKILVQADSTTHYTNEFEKRYRGSCNQMDFFQPESYFLNAINLQLQTELILDKTQAPKGTARARTTLQAYDANRKYLIEIATNPIQQYYLQKNIEWPQKYIVPANSIRYLTPIWHGSVDNALYAIYQYENILGFYDMQPPSHFLSGFIKKGAELRMSAEVLNRITDGFLKGWPPSFHEHIRRLDIFQEWHFLISQEPFVNLVYEHGDFSPNNILVTPEGPLLIDFEFAKTDQIDGFDLFYNETIRKVPHSEIDDSKRKLHQTKLRLCLTINDDLDFDRVGVIYHTLLPNKQNATNDTFRSWIEILNYSGSTTINLMQCRQGITLNKSPESLENRHALEALPENTAEKLARRWHQEKVLIHALEVSCGCALSRALLSYRLSQIFIKASTVKEILKIFRRLLTGRLYFSWKKSFQNSSLSLKLYHGNLKNYLAHWI